MSIAFPKTTRGQATLATASDIEKEQETNVFLLASDSGAILISDSGSAFLQNLETFGYTHPNLHRRIESDPYVPQGSDYAFVHYDKDGNAYKQSVALGVWDGLNSYRTTTTYTHDEESTTCEIP